jgi:hypothetical protein
LNYDYRFYTPKFDDPYNPAVCGLASFFIPGLGQMIAGEPGRGFEFWGGSMGCLFIASGGMLIFPMELMVTEEFPIVTSSIIMLSLLGYTSISILSILDATKVAKVNNMYLQDFRHKYKIDDIESMRLTPYVDRLSINNQVVTPVGLKLSVTF